MLSRCPEKRATHRKREIDNKNRLRRARRGACASHFRAYRIQCDMYYPISLCTMRALICVHLASVFILSNLCVHIHYLKTTSHTLKHAQQAAAAAAGAVKWCAHNPMAKRASARRHPGDDDDTFACYLAFISYLPATHSNRFISHILYTHVCECCVHHLHTLCTAQTQHVYPSKHVGVKAIAARSCQHRTRPRWAV